MEHETMEFDVIIVGAGPSGLAAAIQLKQLAAKTRSDITICILEKGSQVGAHLMSGAVLEPRSLKALLPDCWQNAPLSMPVKKDRFYFLTKKHAIRFPTPPQMRNDGNFIISLGELCQFLAQQAEAMGCEIYPGFAASEVLYNDQGQVIGVATGNVGIDKIGQKTPQFQPGMHLLAKQTLFAEGCRGQLSQALMSRFNLRQDVQPQTYGIGLKEIWRIQPENHQPGHVIHTFGWPLDRKVYGGSFIYHAANAHLALGFVIGLDYENPWLDPYLEFQRFKTHPFVSPLLNGAERISYGARAINEGGWQSIPKLIFPGGALIGDAAGFLNVPKIKGIHAAIQSGMLAAEACFDALQTGKTSPFELTAYPQTFKDSWLAKELYRVRNIRPGFKYGLWPGFLNATLETLSLGHLPWTLKHRPDHKTLRLANECQKINYPKPDGVITFDRMSSVFLTNTYHEENQPCHLKLRDPALAIEVNYQQYASPEVRYCPAGVYEILDETTNPRLQINAQNCIHCKTCDIKDPLQNIVWTAPEGGGGPNYIGM